MLVEETKLRLKLLENGYTPLRNRDKRTFLKGWPSLIVDAEMVQRWGRIGADRATGIRVEAGLAVIDIDVNDREMVDDIAEIIYRVAPQLDGNPNLMVRYGSGFKEAWFVRTAETFSRLFTRGWTRDGDEDGAAYRVEIFGGASPRQFGAFGPHTINERGVVEIEYEWADGVSPATVPFDDVPELGKAHFHAIIDEVEKLFAARGWHPVKLSSSGESDATRVYDLTEEHIFDCDDGETRTLAAVREALRAGLELRCSASWLEGSVAVNRTRCLLSLTRSGAVACWESASGVTHIEERARPHVSDPAIDRLAERLRELKDKRVSRIKTDEDCSAVAAKLLASRAYNPYDVRSVVPLWARSSDCGMTLQAFRTEFLPWCEVEVGPRGGERKINPVDIWASSSQRVTVGGLRMRPDKPRPTFVDSDDLTYINTYAPPEHVDTEGLGVPDGGVALIEHLIPDESERHWFMCWLAHKARRPHIPGPAVIMVAREHGTGRGTLGEMVKLLFGSQYVPTIGFDIFAGLSSQAAYTDWAADALIALVSEGADPDGAPSYAKRRGVYEHLKELVEPRPVEKTYIVKGGRHFRSLHTTSFLIATNNADALPLPADDRRFMVITNGGLASDTFWDDINAWMSVPENIAAFWELLQTYDIGDWSPFARPPKTAGALVMSGLSASDVDDAFAEACGELPGKVFTVAQVTAVMRRLRREGDLEFPDRWEQIVKRKAARELYRIGTPNGLNWQPSVGGKRAAVYARSGNVAARWTSASRDELIMELKKNDGAGGDNVVSLADRLGKL